MKTVALWFHLSAGGLAVIGMLLAWLAPKGRKWHRLGGKMYVYSMTLALCMAIGIALATNNIFLLLIGLFSGYLVYTGWKSAKTRDGLASRTDRYTAAAMVLISALMMVFGFWLLWTGEDVGTVLLVFAVLGGIPAWQDWQRAAWPVGKDRIILHIGRMGGATIATLTAVFVVNVQTQPQFIAWILPSVLFTPIIVYFSRQQRAPQSR